MPPTQAWEDSELCQLHKFAEHIIPMSQRDIHVGEGVDVPVFPNPHPGEAREGNVRQPRAGFQRLHAGALVNDPLEAIVMRQAVFVGFILVSLWTAGCANPVTNSPSVTTTSEGQTIGAPSGTAAAQQGNALVRLVNVDPEKKDVDVVGGGEKYFSAVSFKTVTAYVEIPRGLMQFKLRDAGSTEDLSANHQELMPGRRYTLIVLPRGKGDSRLMVLSDKLGLLDPGETRVRLINATTGVDDLDLFLAGTTNRILHGIDAGMKVTTSFADMEAGDVEIRSPSRPAPTLVTKVTVEPERLYTFIVIGSPGKLDVVRIVDHTEP